MQVLRCTKGRTPVYIAPKRSAELETELIFGQCFRPLRILRGYVEGEVVPLLPQDGYPNDSFTQGEGEPMSRGFVREKDIAVNLQPASHKITALQASVFTKANIKSQIKMRLPFGARLSVLTNKDSFVKIARGQYIHSRHIAPINDYVDDFTAAAERHMGLPYIWGGVSSDGLDCSGLVQSALWAAGRACPRNSGDQEKYLGRALDRHAPLQRGDLIFWPGHVGIMQDAARLLHANAFHMCTASEPLSQAAARIKKSDGPIRSIKRL